MMNAYKGDIEAGKVALLYDFAGRFGPHTIRYDVKPQLCGIGVVLDMPDPISPGTGRYQP